MDAAHETHKDELRFFRRLPWEKMTTWALFLLLIYALRDFFDIVVITFVLTYIAKNAVEWIGCRTGRIGRKVWFRQTSVVAVYIVFLACIFALGRVMLPSIYDQGNALIRKLRQVPLNESLGMPASGAHPLPGPQSGHAPSPGSEAREPAPQAPPASGGDSPAPPSPANLKELILNNLPEWLRKDPYTKFFHSELFDNVFDSALAFLGRKLPEWTQSITDYLQSVLTFFIHFLLSIAFSFLIVWDLPKLEHTTIELPGSRFRDFCREIYPTLWTFSSVMGRAFQAQTLIALCNTVLTYAGAFVLGLENKAFLSVIVFICSFIPVLGVFISTVPMCAVALLQKDGGFDLTVSVVIMVTILHLIEGYILNPAIMGGSFGLHPVLVLVILLVGKHFFGVWGLLLGVPLCHYLFHYVILGNHDPSMKQSALWGSLYPEAKNGAEASVAGPAAPPS